MVQSTEKIYHSGNGRLQPVRYRALPRVALTALSCHCHMSQLSDMPSEIPVDILLYILDYVDKADLATMCRVNKICCSYSQDVLYRDIFVTLTRRKVHQTLAQSAHLAKRVRSFQSCYIDPYLATALRNMTSLRILKLSKVYVKLFDGCTFKLDSFEFMLLTKYRDFSKFLSSQPSLKCVAFPSCFDYRMPSLEASCLPNLTRINATFPWLPYIIPGRPLNEIISTGSIPYDHGIDLNFFALSTTPIQKLTIDYCYLYRTPGHLLASFLPSLTHFTLTVWEHKIYFKNEGVCGLPLYLLLDIEQHGIVWT
jgi:hypothetical protein